MEEEFSMDDFIIEDDDLDFENYNNPDEGDDPEDVVRDKVDDDVTPSEEDDNPLESDDNDDETDNENNNGDDNDTSSLNLYSSLAKVLYEEGVTPHLNLETDKVESVEDLISVIKKEIQTSEFEGLTDNQKFYLNAIREGIPEETIKDTIEASITIESITEDDLETNEDLRVNIISQYYIAKGMSDKEASKLAQRSVNLAEDLDDAKSSLAALKDMTEQLKTKQLEDAKLQREKIVNDNNQKLIQLKQTITDIDEIIPGNKIDPKAKDVLYNIITKPVAEKDGKPVNAVFNYMSENPVDAQIKLAYIYSLTDGFKNMDKLITSKAKSKASRELEDTLRRTKFNATGTHNFNTNDNDSSYGIDDYDLI